MTYLPDANPEIARARKPEYPIDFLHGCWRTYFLLAGILGCMTVIPPLPLSDAKREVENAIAGVLAKGETQIAADLDTAFCLVQSHRSCTVLVGCNNYLSPPLPTQPAPK